MPRGKTKRRVAKKKVVRKVVHKPGPKPAQQGPTTGVDAATSRNEMLKAMLSRGMNGGTSVIAPQGQMDPRAAALLNSLSNKRADLNFEKSAIETARAEEQHIKNEQKQLKRDTKSFAQQQKVEEQKEKLADARADLQEQKAIAAGLNELGQIQKEHKQVSTESKQVEKEIEKKKKQIKGNPEFEQLQQAKAKYRDLLTKRDALQATIDSDEFQSAGEHLKNKLVDIEVTAMQIEHADNVLKKKKENMQLEARINATKEAMEKYKTEHGVQDANEMKELKNK